jgi:AcrR family transcriptional regulator
VPKRKAAARADRDAAAMRQRLLDAAVGCLIELGVAGTTTLAVQLKAGTSRGALLHHFPTHADLLAASVAELVKRNEQAVAASRTAGTQPNDKLRAAIGALAFAGRQPAYLAELEMWAMARTDARLSARRGGRSTGSMRNCSADGRTRKPIPSPPRSPRISCGDWRSRKICGAHPPAARR